MKYRYLISDEDGTLTGTNDLDLAERYAENDCNIYDCEEGKILFVPPAVQDVPEAEALPDEGDNDD